MKFDFPFFVAKFYYQEYMKVCFIIFSIQPSSAKCKRSKPDAIEKTKQNYKEPIVGCFKTTVDRNPQKFINPVKKKKTIAFGRTVNISQTIEVNFLIYS